jgi:hypothetical protein
VTHQHPTDSHAQLEPACGVTTIVSVLLQVTVLSFAPHTISSPSHTLLPSSHNTEHVPSPQLITVSRHADPLSQRTVHAFPVHVMGLARQPLLPVHSTAQSQPSGHASASPSHSLFPSQRIVHTVPAQPPVHSAGHITPHAA